MCFGVPPPSQGWGGWFLGMQLCPSTVGPGGAEHWLDLAQPPPAPKCTWGSPSPPALGVSGELQRHFGPKAQLKCC